GLVGGVRAEGADVVRVHYSQPFAKALTNWGTWMLPRHLLETYVREGRIREAPQNWTAPVGTGPYRVKEMRSGEKIVLVSNPDYWEGRPYISHIVSRIIPSLATTVHELKAKAVDPTSLSALQASPQTDHRALLR